MAALQRIRGEETTWQLVVDGVVQQGGFVKVENWKITPKKDLTESDFIGETESDFDVQFHGWELNFTIHESDASADNIMDTVISNQEAGVPQPAISIVVRKTFRDPALSPRVYVYSRGVMSMDDNTAGGRKDFVKSTWTYKCKKRKVLAAT